MLQIVEAQKGILVISVQDILYVLINRENEKRANLLA